MFKKIVDALRMADIRSKRTYPCCRMPWNLTQEDSGRQDLYVERCVCGRRHRIMRADPGVLGVHGRETGGQKG